MNKTNKNILSPLLLFGFVCGLRAFGEWYETPKSNQLELSLKQSNLSGKMFDKSILNKDIGADNCKDTSLYEEQSKYGQLVNALYGHNLNKNLERFNH